MTYDYEFTAFGEDDPTYYYVFDSNVDDDYVWKEYDADGNLLSDYDIDGIATRWERLEEYGEVNNN